MANTITDQAQMEAAAQSVAAKLQAFQANLSPDERALLQVAFGQMVSQSNEDGADTKGYLTPTYLPAVSVRIQQEVNTLILINQIKEFFGIS